MKRSFLVLFFLFSFQFVDYSQQSDIRHFEIKVEPWGRMFGGGTFATITDDSIKIACSRSIEDKEERYSKRLNERERSQIKYNLKKIDLLNLKANYTDNDAPDDMGEFDFILTIDKAQKKIHIYQVKVDPIFNLVAEINKMVPEKFQIEYNNRYFPQGK